MDELKKHVKELHPMHDTNIDNFCSHFDDKTQKQCSKHFSLFRNQHKHDTVLERCTDLTTNALETFNSCVDITIRERRAFKETMHSSYRELNHLQSGQHENEKPMEPAHKVPAIPVNIV